MAFRLNPLHIVRRKWLIRLNRSARPALLVWAGSLFGEGHSDVTKPVKPFATIDEQIDVLASRGLVLDRTIAEQWLRNIGYYRLSGYWYPYREISDPQRPERLDGFIPGASFDDVVQLYEFDRKLRTLIHDGIERVEVALRSHVSYMIGSIGPLAYRDATLFRPTFDHGAGPHPDRSRPQAQ